MKRRQAVPPKLGIRKKEFEQEDAESTEDFFLCVLCDLLFNIFCS